MPQVNCSISNCYFYKQGNLCGADAIMIDSDHHAHKRFNEEYAGEDFRSEHQDSAESSSMTCCQTFRPKR